MKFLFFTDTHIRGTNPRNRKDNFYEALKLKFAELKELCDSLEIDYVLHGGDWFDRPDVSPAIVKDFALMIKDFGRPVYTVSGNHDIYGHNPETVGRTMLGLLEGVGLITLMGNEDEFILKDDRVKVQLTGRPYRFDMDGEDFRRYYLVKKRKDVDYAINIIHGMLLTKPFFEGIRYTLVDDIKDTEADITLAGHYHNGFGIVCRDGKYFINPGSLVRITNTMGEISRRPKAVFIQLDERVTVKELELKSAREGEEVLDRTQLEKSQDRVMRLQQFYRELSSSGRFDRVDIQRIIEDIAADGNLSSEIKDEAVRRIAIARENLSEGEEP